MRNLVYLFLAASLAVFSASCTKSNPERYTVEAAAYCKERHSDSHIELFLIPNKNNLKDHYGNGEMLPAGWKKLYGYDWFRITLEAIDQSDDIFNQDYKLINCNKTLTEESLRGGYAKVYWNTQKNEFASGGTVKIGTNSVTLLARFPLRGWLEVKFEGDIVKYENIVD